jgi:putative phosphoribosyl transferase
MKVAIEALRKAGAEHVTVAIPTAHKESVESILKAVDDVFCPNLRSGWQFAVASAYEKWSDVTEQEVIHILENSNSFQMATLGE